MISINTVCQNVRHKGNFEICRPDGSGDDLLVIFKTSAVLIQNGENVAGSTNRKQYENMLMQMILMKISESSINPDSDKSRISALEMLRTDIYSNAGSYSNIYQLAEKMNLSPSYLQAIYKRKFGISC